MNKDAWDRIPADLQQILLEEGAKAELEALRVMAILDTMEFQRNVNAGLVSVEFPQEVQDYSFTEAVIGNVVPGWIKRVGVDNPIIDAFNEKVGPWVNIRVEADGSVTNLRPQAMAEAATLKAYADANAGGPGAVYAGDITQMVGPASRVALGNDDGLIPLKELQEHVYIYETEEYQNLLIKAGVWNPTELVSSGESVKLQVACINRTLGRCQVIEDFLVPNLAERTNGQVDLDITSFPELGIAGPDTISLVRDGTLGMVEIYTGYVAGEIPAVEIIALFGSWPTREVAYLAINSLLPDLDEIIVDASEGVVVGHVWGPGEDQFIWSQKPLDSVEAFKNIKVRSHASALSDWLEGMGADAQFLAFAEVYTALERGILDAAVTGAGPGLGQRWYEVAKYINGPLPGAMPTTLVINQDVWAEIPADLQQIIIEEGARNELESLRFIAMMDTQDFIRNVEAGLEFVQFPPEVQEHSLNEAFIGQVLPSWINRLGGADRPIIELFNKKVGSRVGVFIEADGTVLKVPVTKTN
jgi:TRAP-type C4-dicarboxylate transport system substrate-binding protein